MRIHGVHIGMLLVALAVASASRARADWPQAGLPIATGPGARSLTALVPDASGGVYVVWSNGAAVPGAMQHAAADGTLAPGWPAAGLPLTDARVLGAAADGAGGLYVFAAGPVWTDTLTGDFGRNTLAFHYGADGLSLAGWPDSGTVITRETHLASDDLGVSALGFALGFPDGAGGVTFVNDWARGIFAGWSFSHFGDGNPGTYRGLVKGTLGTNGLAADPDGSGGLAVLRITEDVVDAFHFVPNAGAMPTRHLHRGFVNTDGGVLRLSPGTDFLYSWSDNSTTQATWMRAHADLSTAPGWTDSSTLVPAIPLLADGAGGVFAKVQGGSGAEVQRFDVATASIGAQWPANARPAFHGGEMGTDAAGGYFEVWGNGPLRSPLRALHVKSDGTIAARWAQSGVLLSSFAGPWRVAPAGAGAMFVAWHELPTSPSDDPQIYLQRIADDAPVPALVSLASASASPERVVVEWQVSEAPAALGIERRVGGEAWLAAGPPRQVARDLWRYEDTAIRAGQSLAYRLVDAGRVLAGSEAAVRVPEAERFALRGFTSNPVTSDRTIEFSLPDAAPARLELLDVAGRVLARREVGALGAGTHRVAFDEAWASRPGLVFARLVRAGDVRTTRAAILR